MAQWHKHDDSTHYAGQPTFRFYLAGEFGHHQPTFHVMTLLNFKKSGDTFDFTHAKTALFFCNGPWCVQSRWAIEKIDQTGVIKRKLLWYRGGLQDWLLFGFTVVKNNR